MVRRRSGITGSGAEDGMAAQQIGRADDEIAERTSWGRRVRSTVLLVVLVLVLGALAAGVIGVVVVGLASVIDHALEG
jgi:hypothetical protein